MGVLVDHATEHLLYALVTGYCLHNSVYYHFGRLDRPDEWFPAQNFGDIKLKLTGESAAGAVKVLTQQLRI